MYAEGSLRVAVIEGGPSSEAEVSRVSAVGVASALERAGHRVARFECDRTLPAALLAGGFDVVFPVVHGALGEDGALQGLLEIVALPYVGAGVLGSALANDKVAAKVAFRAAALPVARELVLLRGVASLATQARHAFDDLGCAMVVKPSTQGSAIGITPLQDLAGPDDPRLIAALDAAFDLDARVLIERFHAGREVTCGVLDLDAPHALPPTEIRAKAASWYDFRSRYGTDGSTHLCPAPLHATTLARVQEIAVAAHRALGVRDLSRADFIVGPGDADAEVTLLEVNTMPGFTATSLFPEAAALAGIPFAQLCASLVGKAFARGVRVFGPAIEFPT